MTIQLHISLTFGGLIAVGFLAIASAVFRFVAAAALSELIAMETQARFDRFLLRMVAMGALMLPIAAHRDELLVDGVANLAAAKSDPPSARLRYTLGVLWLGVRSARIHELVGRFMSSNRLIKRVVRRRQDVLGAEAGFSYRRPLAAVGLAFDRVLLGESFTQYVSETIKQTRFRSSITALLMALDAREERSSQHSSEVLALVSAVAADLGLDVKAQSLAADVVLLHDIGKIGIPAEILEKRSRLSDAEWEVMRRYPIIGERILKEVPGFESISDAVRHAHERWDGGGYPDMLSGDEIPIVSRIVLACDAYQSMISDKPYRPRLSEEQATAELRLHSGTQFDPKVVAALLRVLGEREQSAALPVTESSPVGAQNAASTLGGVVLAVLALLGTALLLGVRSLAGLGGIAVPIVLGFLIMVAYLRRQSARMFRNRGRFESTISSLLVALQERDGYAAEHSEEAIDLALAIADELRIGENDRAVLADSALLHDIGKIGIPSEVLNKPDGLTNDEWALMKKHPEIGERIVSPVPGFSLVAKSIRHQHERWDGAGYPDGLIGEEIPIASRVVLSCSAFLAMIKDRPYRKSIDVAHARAELVRHAGTQFDPMVVDALLRVVDETGVPGPTIEVV